MNTPVKQQSSTGRPRIALITNHGYAGVEIPVGGAPDTGGQNFYVNSLAPALEAVGYEVTIFARGGFPFFQSDRIRQGTEQLTEHVRYVYIPGGGDEFLRKEDIAIALDEETAWLDRFIANEAKAIGIEPPEYYEIVNTHYWDAAVIAVKLVERWKNQAALKFLNKAAGGKLASHLARFEGEAVHRLGLSREIDLHLAEIARSATGAESVDDIVQELTGQKGDAKRKGGKEDLAQNMLLGQTLRRLLKTDGVDLKFVMDKADTHVWTPHSLGIIKERNYWDKDEEIVRKLKFRERDAHEQVVCKRTHLFCSTSPELSEGLVSYHSVAPENVFDFPPCIDANIFRPRTEDELVGVYKYLAEQSGIAEEKLKKSKVIFETSRMDRTKRKDILLQSFAQVAKTQEDVYLFIGGGPAGNPIFKELEALKSTLPELDGRAFLLGFVPDEMISPLFSVPDLFVSASEMEGFGMSVSQAAAAGVAVVSSDLIPFATQYAKGAAVVVKAGDVDGFAKAMTQLLNDDGERKKRAKQLMDVAKELDWIATSKRFIDWYKKVRVHR